MSITVKEIRVPPYAAPFMERHGEAAAKAVTDFLKPIKDPGEQLGALGILALVLTEIGDAIRAKGPGIAGKDGPAP